MPTPSFQAIDHLHVHVNDRPAAEAWYGRVLGLRRLPALDHWAADGGPLTLSDDAGSLHLALFERPTQPGHATIALRVPAAGLHAWRAHLRHELGEAPALVDHGESRSIYFRDPDGNPFEITSYEPDDGLHALLDEELAHAPEHGASAGGGAYSTHLPMALHALAALGAPPERLHAWAARHFPQVPALDWPELASTEERLRNALQREGLDALLQKRLPPLLAGSGAMAFHGLIRVAHMLEAGHEAQLLRSLAYWSLRAEALPGPAEVTGEKLGLAEWADALLALPRPDLRAAWITLRMQAVAAQPAFQALAPRLRLGPALPEQLARWAAGAYAASGNFTLLHALTGTRALLRLLPRLPPAARPAALRDFTRHLGAALIASRWTGQALPAIEPPDWATLKAAAVAHDDEHAIKAVHAAWQLGAHDADPVWRQAAARALATQR